MIIAGMSNKEIAAKLKMTVNTVKTHTNSIYGKLQVNRILRSPEQCLRAQAAGMIYKLLNFLGKQTGLQFICLKMQGSLGDPGAAFHLSSGYVYPMRPSSRC